MSSISAALTALGNEEKLLQRRAASIIDVNRATHSLKQSVEKLHASLGEIKIDRPKLNPDEVWRLFEEGRYDLSALNALQFRTLCSHEGTALHSQFVSALMRDSDRLKRSTCLYGLVNAYFSGWRDMADPEVVEGLLVRAFRYHDDRNPVTRLWKQNVRLFSDSAHEFLADIICRDKRAVDDVLEECYVRPTSKLALVTRAAAAIGACRILLEREKQPTRYEESLQLLNWITGQVLSPLTSQDTFYLTVSALILCPSTQRSVDIQRVLRAYVQANKRLGDPRVRESAVNWTLMTPQARQRYLSWLARDSIAFFFNTILPNNNENSRRKEFWLKYHDSILDFQVAVSEADLWKVKQVKAGSEVLLYSVVAHPTASAFLMRFRGYSREYIVVEFSEKGNAAYIFTADSFEARHVTMRTHRFDLKNHLKFDDTHRILHMSDWESRAAYRLASEFGIRP